MKKLTVGDLLEKLKNTDPTLPIYMQIDKRQKLASCRAGYAMEIQIHKDEICLFDR